MSVSQHLNLSFVDLFSKQNLLVEIPILQRDYAYGRASETRKRKDFLLAIKNYLASDKVNNELDFIYGSQTNRGSNEVLVLLDGQQRITTLFLLHWYFAITGKKYDDFRKLMTYENRSKFTYRVRKSSYEFCNALLKLCNGLTGVSEENDFYNFLLNSSLPLSKFIKEKRWFHKHWDNDPTVVNMLTMLDSIQGIFNLKESESFYDKLNKSGKESCITFNYLQLVDYGLTDELYIKMNSRGKPLTRFENLKVKILNLLDEKYFNDDKAKDRLRVIDENYSNTTTIRDYVSLKFDTNWTDMLWAIWLEDGKTEKPQIDEMFLSFIVNFCIYYHILNLSNGQLRIYRKSEEEMEVEYLLETISEISAPGTSFDYDKIISILKSNDYKALFDLIDLFNLLSIFNNSWQFKQYFTSAPLLLIFKETECLKDILYSFEKQLTYEQRFMFYAYLSYLLKYKPTINDNLFEEWIRFAYNLCNNSYQLANSCSDFCNSILGINYLIDRDCYNALQKKDKITELATLDSEQLKEEILKSKLFSNQKWKDSINDAYIKLSYFEGQLSFELLDCCKTSENDINNDQKIDEFKLYVDKVSSIFTDSEKGCPFDESLICALLSKGNYLTGYHSSASLYQSTKNRDIGWKRFLKKDSSGDNLLQRGYFIEILNDKSFNMKLPKDSLDSIAKNRSSSIERWRIVLIDNFSLLKEKLGASRLIRWNYANNKHKNDVSNLDNFEIDLISRLNITSNHIELFTYSLFINKTIQAYSPFNKCEYYESKLENDEPHIFLSGWKYNNKNYQMQVYYRDDNYYDLVISNEEYCQIDANIVSKASSLGFSFIKPENILLKTGIKGATLSNDMENICKSL